MLDPHLLRNDPGRVKTALSRRGYTLDTGVITSLEARRKQIQVSTQDLQRERNERSREIGKIKAQGGDVQPLLDKVANLGDQLKASEEELAKIQQELYDIAMGISLLSFGAPPARTGARG